MVTIKEIARECGVSFAAVSKALHDSPDISPETTARIKAMARKMGYSRNAAARSLKTGRTHMIGVLYFDRTGVGLAHEYFSLILNSFKEQAEELGYGILFIVNKLGDQQLSYYDYAKSQGCDGILIANLEFRDPEVLELSHGSIPIVTIDHIYPEQNAVLSDNEQCMKELVRYVYNQGHRRIAFIHGDMSDVTKARLSSFRSTCAELGVTIPDDYVISGLFHDCDSSAAATDRLLSLDEPPTCILYPDDFSYIGGKNEIERRGLLVPRDISVAGFDGILLSQVVTPRLATIKQDTNSIGRAAANLLIETIEQKEKTAPKRIYIPGKLLPGESIAKI